MGTAMIRRFAVVATVVLLVPIWCRPSVVARAVEAPGAVLVGLAPSGAASAPAIRRHASPGWWTAGPRPDLGRSLLALGVVALLSLLRLIPWATLTAVRSAPSSLVRRRHVISLRAPPLPLGV